MDELTFKLQNPLTKEDWEKITDANLEQTNEIWYTTPNGNKFLYRKVEHGEWVEITNHEFEDIQVSEAKCTNCNLYSSQMLAYGNISYEYCPRCGAKMRKGETNG